MLQRALQHEKYANKIMPLRPSYTTPIYVQLLAAIVGTNQSENPIHSTQHLIGLRQWLLQTDARKVASSAEAVSRMPNFELQLILRNLKSKSK